MKTKINNFLDKLPYKKMFCISAGLNFFLLLSLLCVSALVGNNNSATKSLPTYTLYPTYTVLPTNTEVPILKSTVAPSSTSRVFVASSTPYITPTPLEANVNVWTQERLQKYGSDMYSLFMNVYNDTQIVQNQLELASNSPDLIFDKTWKSTLFKYLDKLDSDYWAISNYKDYPPQYASAHFWLEKLGPEADKFVNNVKTGTNNLDVDSLNAATVNLQNLTTYMTNAKNSLPENILVQ